MSYSTYDDLILEFPQAEIDSLLDRDRNGKEDDGVADEAIGFADDLIDGYLRERYSVPLTTVPRNLVGVACDIARYRLYQGQPTELVQLRYDAALNWLKDVARGLVTLDVGEVFEDRVAASEPAPVFTRLVW